jgi:hypothetical protein
MSDHFVIKALSRRQALSSVAVATLAAALCVPLSASAANARVVVDQGAALAANVRVVSAPATTSFDVALVAHHARALNDFIRQVNDPTSANYRHFLSTAQFTVRFGVRSETVAAVRNYFEHFGLHVKRALSSGLLLHVSGSTHAIEKAFSANIVAIKRADGVIATQFAGLATLPAQVAHSIHAVAGLSTWRSPHALSVPRSSSTPHSIAPRISTPSSCSGAQTYENSNPGEFNALEQASGYGLNTQRANGFNGAGQTIAVYELAAYRLSDLQHYWSCYGLSPAFSNTSVDFGTSDTSGQEEANLDIEEVSALAPGATIKVYTGPNAGSGPLDVYAAIANDNIASVTSTSWGACEIKQITLSDIQSEQTVFAQMAAQGQSVFASAGDEGSSDCALGNGGGLAVDDPASQPLVTGVGGLAVTSFASSAPSTNLVQAVWNDGVSSGGSGGGGVSTVWSQPSWQAGTTVGTLGGRGVPDLSVMGDPNTGFIDYSSGHWGGVGGTSIGSPIMAAITATANQVCSSRLGLINPSIYQMGNIGTGLNDVTTGNNAIPGKGTGGLYVAKAGYDLASGFGSPDPSAFISSLCQSQPSAAHSSVTRSPASGAVDLASGVTVTLTARTASDTPIAFATPTVSASQYAAHVVVTALSTHTDANGSISYVVSSNRTGTATLKFSMGVVPVGSLSVSFNSSVQVHTAQLSSLGGVASTLVSALSGSGQRVALEVSSTGHLLETAGNFGPVTDLSKKLKLMMIAGTPALSCGATSCVAIVNVGTHVVLVRNVNTPASVSAIDLAKSSSLASGTQSSTAAVVDSRSAGYLTMTWLNASGQCILARWSAVTNKYSFTNLSSTLSVAKATGRSALIVTSYSSDAVALHVGSSYRIVLVNSSSSTENVTALTGYNSSGSGALITAPAFKRDPASGALELLGRTTAGRLVIFSATVGSPDQFSLFQVISNSGVTAAAFISGVSAHAPSAMIYLTSAGTQMALQVPGWNSVSVKALTGAVLPNATMSAGADPVVVSGSVAYQITA